MLLAKVIAEAVDKFPATTADADHPGLEADDLNRMQRGGTPAEDKITDEWLNERNLFEVTRVPRPVADVVEGNTAEFVGGVWRQVWASRNFNAEELAEYKSRALRDIDGGAEGARSQYITSGAGQAMTYLEKAAQAAAALADPSPDPANYPLVRARMNARKTQTPSFTLIDAATEITTTRDAWLAIAEDIEEKRETAKLAITAALDSAAVDAAAAVTW